MDQVKMAQAWKFFNLASRLETEGESATRVNMALDRACKLETEAFQATATS